MTWEMLGNTGIYWDISVEVNMVGEAEDAMWYRRENELTVNGSKVNVGRGRAPGEEIAEPVNGRGTNVGSGRALNEQIGEMERQKVYIRSPWLLVPQSSNTIPKLD